MAERLQTDITYAHQVLGVEAVKAAHKNVATSLKEVDEAAKKATGAGTGLADANKKLAQLGIRTTESIKAEIAQLRQLAEARKNDAAVVAQAMGRANQLQASLDDSSGAMGRNAQASHRGSLFMLNFSRAAEDLKFGLPAVVNNLDALGFSFSLMKRDAETAKIGMGQLLKQSLKSGAGLLALGNVLYTAYVLFGDGLNKAAKEAKKLEEAVKELASVSTDPFKLEFDVASAEAATDQISDALGMMERRWQDMTRATNRNLDLEVAKKLKDDKTALEAFNESLSEQAAKARAAETAARTLIENGFYPIARASDEAKVAIGKLMPGLNDANNGFDITSQVAFDAANELLRVADSIREIRVAESEGFLNELELPEGDIKIPESGYEDTLANELAALVEQRKARAKRAAELERERKQMLSAGDRMLLQLDKENTRLAEQEALRHKIENRPDSPHVAAFQMTPIGQMLDEAEIAAQIASVIAKTDGLETSAMRVAAAFKDGLRQEVEGTAIAIEQWPLDVVDAMSNRIADSAMDLITMQSSFKDFGKDVLQVMKQQVAEMAAMIIKQKMLNALKKQEGLMSGLGLKGLLGGAGVLGGLTPLLLGAGALYGVASAIQSSHKGSQVGSFRSDRSGKSSLNLQLQAATLPSGDVAFAANESDLRRARLGA